MNTAIKEKEFLLSDKVVKKIFTETTKGKEYAARIISESINSPIEEVSEGLVFLHPSVGTHPDFVNSEVDLMLENRKGFINIEINMYYSEELKVKNFVYVCQVALRQVKRARDYENYRKIYQININDYDQFNANQFIYHSLMLEKELHKVRGDEIEIIDINLDYLRKKDYNKEEMSNLEKSLYFFICRDKEKLKEMYEGDEVMGTMLEEAEIFDGVCDELLYYDREALINAGSKELGMKLGREEGREEGEKNKQLEIAKKMLEKGKKEEEILEFIDITKEELEKLKF